jgi:phage FluMu protein Com
LSCCAVFANVEATAFWNWKCPHRSLYNRTINDTQAENKRMDTSAQFQVPEILTEYAC